MIDTKICKKCKVEKSISLFGKRKDAKDGLKHECRTCDNLRSLGWAQKNREKSNAIKKAYEERNQEKVKESRVKTYFKYKEKKLLYAKSWKAINKEKIKEQNKIYSNTHLESVVAKTKNWRLNNPEKYFLQRKKYMEAHPEKRTDRGNFWYVLKPEILRRDNYTCLYCNKIGGTLNAHHISPWAADPENRFNEQNVITLCKNCHSKAHNNSKWKTINEDIAKQLTLIIEEKYKETNNDSILPNL